jgi:HTH-type transcriptional regulator, sugar sensing transcriptional regulator
MMSQMDDQLISQVEDLGLSNKEARVYVASLMLGPSPVQKIGDFADIKRVTTYVILESLVNLGLVSQTTKGKKTLFIAEDPSNLRRLLSKKEQALKEQKDSFETILPQLKNLKTLPADTPGVRFYDSPEGIRTVLANFISGHKDSVERAYGISNADQIEAFFPEIKFTTGNPDRIKAGLPSRVIYTSAKGPLHHGSDQQLKREIRYVPVDKYPISGDLTIVGHHIIMLALAGNRPLGITIESKDIADNLVAFFELAWEAAAKYNLE